MTINNKTLKETNEIKPSIRPPETMTSLAWKRFRRHPGAMVGSVVLILLILAAVFADLSPYDPEVSDIANRYQSPH